MLAKGREIRAKLIEVVEADRWIVSFQGELLQVQNTTDIRFKAGLMLDLVVESARPLRLKVLDASTSDRKKIDFIV